MEHSIFQPANIRFCTYMAFDVVAYDYYYDCLLRKDRQAGGSDAGALFIMGDICGISELGSIYLELGRNLPSLLFYKAWKT